MKLIVISHNLVIVSFIDTVNRNSEFIIMLFCLQTKKLPITNLETDPDFHYAREINLFRCFAAFNPGFGKNAKVSYLCKS
jgi:hypothetical protein